MCRVIGRGFAGQDDSHLPMVWTGKVKADWRKPSPKTRRYPGFRATSVFMFFRLQQSDIDSNAKPPLRLGTVLGNLRGGQVCVGCKSHHRWASIISTKQRVCPCRSLMPSCGFLCCTLVDSHGNKKGQVHGSSRTTFTKLYLFILICGSKTVLISSSSSKMLPRTANKSSAN